MISEIESERCGVEEKPRIKSLWNQIKYPARDLRKITRQMQEEEQEKFGDDAEQIKRLIVAAIDRAGTDPELFEEIISHVLKMESKLNINLKIFGI